MKKVCFIFALCCGFVASNAMSKSPAGGKPDDVTGNPTSEQSSNTAMSNKRSRPEASAWEWPWDRKNWNYTSPTQVVDNVPTLYITTTTGKDPADKETYLPCTIQWVENGEVIKEYTLTAEAGGGIRGRGNSTWDAEKKPWRIKFDDKEKFLGDDYANAKSWTLLANAYDKSLIRNALTYHIGKVSGLDYCPAYCFVDLVLNGTYRGTYQISDQLEVRKKRVLANNADTDWLLEYGNCESKVDEPKFTFRADNADLGWFQIKSPEFEDDNVNSNPELYNAMKSYFNDNIASKLSLNKINYDYIDPRTGYRAEVDTASLINWYVALEITNNCDGFFSMYMYRAEDGPLCFGPLWDFDLAYGLSSFQTNRNYIDNTLLAFSNYDKSKLGIYYLLYGDDKWGYFRRFQPYMAHFFDDPWFVNAVKMRYDELYYDGLKDKLLEIIDELSSSISKSAAMNFERWSISGDDCPSDLMVRNQSKTWEGYVSLLKTWISNRIETLKTEFDKYAAGNIYFDEKQDNEISNASSSKNVVMRRPFVSGTWNTMCLPFALTSDEINYLFGEGTVVEEFTGINKQGNSVTFKFNKVSNTVAGVPYLVMPAKDVTVPFAFLNKTFASAARSVNYDGCAFVGTYSPVQLKGDGTQWFVSSGNKLKTPSASSSKLKGLRAYFDLDASVSASVKEIAFDYDEEAMGIEDVIAETIPADTKIYNLNGQYVGIDRSQLARGIYIIGGKKVLVK